VEQQIHKTTFEGGLNTDVAKQLVSQNQYIAASNLSLVNDGNFLVLENLKGTTAVETVTTNSTATILGVFPTKYTIGTTEDVKCLTIIYHLIDTGVHYYKIDAYDTENDLLYRIYSTTVPSNYLGNDRVVDAILFAENGLNLLYLTDYYQRPQKLRCFIPGSYAGSAFLTKQDVELLRVPAIGDLRLSDITTGGSLLTGTYQLAYQLYNPTSNKATGFSLLGTPIHIYTTQGISTLAGVGLGSNKKIKINIYPTEDELAYYTHFRVAVVENVGATTTPTTNVGVTNYEAISTWISGSVITNYEIKSNTQYQFVTIDELVVDLAAIQRIKTLTVRDNRLILGNVILSDLSLDNGTPAIGGGSVLKQSISGTPWNSGESDLFQSLYRGHFRDEVYRYAISYFDNNGNFSSPKTLNLNNGGSAVTHNRIAAGGIDMKFPSRGYRDGSTYYTVLESVQHKMVHLGLRLTNIVNHPKWAKGFIILRAKRKKNIEFQTPLVPLVKLHGIGAVQNYPTEYRVGSGLTLVNDTTLSPMGPSDTFVPYNMFYGSPAASPGALTTGGGTGANLFVAGESQPLQYVGNAAFVMFFPPESIYGEGQSRPFSGSEQFQAVDAVLCEAYMNRFDTLAQDPGYRVGTSVAGAFFAVRNGLHYYDDGHLKSENAFRSGVKIKVNNPTFFDNYQEGKKFGGSDIMDYTKVSTSGVEFGFLPSNQRCAVADFNYDIINARFSPPTFAGGVPTVKSNATQGGYSNVLGNEAFQQNVAGLWEIPALNNLGSWDVVTNTPTVSDGTGALGDYYGPVTGITPPGDPFVRDLGSGNITFYNGDYIRHDGTKWVSSRQGFTYYSNVIEINNVINGLDDFRYGAEDEYNEFIYTGTKVVFTNAEVTNNIIPGTSLPKTVDVWGGDCVVSPHTFKVSDSTYTIVNQRKLSGNGQTPSQLGEYWDKVWLDTTDVAGLSMPVFYKNAAQYLTVVLESEYNGSAGDLTDQDWVHTTSGGTSIDIYGSPTEARARFARPYLYNINLNKENDQKVFIPIDSLTDIITKYKSRLYFSDLKVYQSDLDGFDTVRVLNFHDLQESFGALTKLTVVGDRLFGLQEQGVSIIPVGERILETTDTSQLAVRSGEFFGDPVYIDTLRGTQHLGSVVNTGQIVYFADNINRAICALSSEGLRIISGEGLSTKCRTIFTTPIIERNLVGAYDILKDNYWIVNKSGTFALRWNEGFKKWESDTVFQANGFGGAAAINNKFFIVGKEYNTNETKVHTMYTGNYSEFAGAYSGPSVTFVVNSEADLTKVFDAILVNSNGALQGIDVVVEKQSGTQTTTADTMVTQRGEGNWKLKILRDGVGARLRGVYALVTLRWNAGGAYPGRIYVSTVLTKYRPSHNRF